MEPNKRELEALVASQKEQLSRYEKRLKDVVTAYKGLLKEKEALEMSLAVTANPNNTQSNDNVADTNSTEEVASNATPAVAKDTEDKGQLQTQILTLMNSLATLSGEKSRMEASFQADKKQLRAKLTQKDQTIAELQTKLKESAERAKANVDEVKAKWIIERQEREKESNNQMIMIRELQKLYAEERHLKESIEMQLNNFKTQFANNEAENTRVRELQAELKEAKEQLKELENSQRQGNNIAAAERSAAGLRQVQEEMQQLKDQHAAAIKLEQHRVQQAEELSRKQAALHEDRVANLEERLAELSTTVGTYDRLRQQDQQNIQVLKNKLQELERNTDIVANAGNEQLMRHKNFMSNTQDVAAIVDEIMRLKKLLMHENARAANPIDVTQVFVVGADHTQCQAELKRTEKLLEEAKHEITQLQEKQKVQRAHISTLQDKVKILNRNIDEQELDIKQQHERQLQAVKEERAKWKNALTELENEHRCRVNELEQQLQKQRQRSLQLLEEKEQEIKTLQTSFEVFHSAAMPAATSSATSANNSGDHHYSSDGESTDGNTNHSKPALVRPKKLSVGENCHMLHYANEIARKDIEIAALRKSKYSAEQALRKTIQDKLELSEKIETLEEEVDRLERCKTREGANLEYLKNVIISFISTKDADGKRHMMNAISAVLQFTPGEIQTINAAFQKK